MSLSATWFKSTLMSSMDLEIMNHIEIVIMHVNTGCLSHLSKLLTSVSLEANSAGPERTSH